MMTKVKIAAAFGVTILIGALVAAVLWQWNSITALSAQVAAETEKVRVAVEANKQSQVVIDRITEMRSHDDTVLRGVADALSTVAAKQEQVRTNIRKLERGSNAVRDFLATPLPADLARLLNEARAGRGPENVGVPSAVRSRQ